MISGGCLIAIVLLIANIYLTIRADSGNEKERFYKTLDSKLIARYEKIIRERKRIYIYSFSIGLLLSGIAIYMCKIPRNLMACLVGAITLSVTYLGYIIYPKSDYMIIHLHNEKQRMAWLDIYRSMQLKYHVGLVIGIVAAMSLGYSFGC
tara:strand:- start:48 stop:497 length:450 start_codon:yes stop_codon:yes gene_type:complete